MARRYALVFLSIRLSRFFCEQNPFSNNHLRSYPPRFSPQKPMLYALYPYRIVGGPNNNKFIFDRKIAPRFKAPRNFRIGNYYTAFKQDALDKNPKLVQNPNM
jgi:hypothetical protein